MDAIPFWKRPCKKNTAKRTPITILESLTRTRMFQKAAEHYRAAVELNPGYSQTWNNLGVTLDVLGAKDKALAAFERAVATDRRTKKRR